MLWGFLRKKKKIENQIWEKNHCSSRPEKTLCFSNWKNLSLHLIKNKYSYQYRINTLARTNKDKSNVDMQLLFEVKHI